MKKTKIIYGLAIILLVSLMGNQKVFCESVPDLEQRVKVLEQNAESKKTGPKEIWDRFSVFGTIELDYSYLNDNDLSDNTLGDSESDLDIGTIELGLEANLHKYVTAVALLKGEALDSDDDRIFWDEVFFTFAKQGMPVYFTGGKRVQPFGVYESLFINDPITQDLYEINKTGATIGFFNEEMLNMDISFTIYKGEILTNRIHEAEYGWERDNTPGYEETNDLSSYIASASFSPMEGMSLSAYFNSEPGETERNTTLGASFHWEIANFIADAEYIGALNREKHVADNKEYTESAWVTSLGYQVLDSLVLAVRYEGFYADKKQAGNLDYRYGLGATYSLFKNDDFACNLLGEYRRTEYESSAGNTVDSDLNEFFARIALEF
ncbi:MAG: LbtU family siderophore porin [Desulfobacteraceae bacterium]|nr:LbtU family siderophore porin [Desulfobacteraceae bacterium]